MSSVVDHAYASFTKKKSPDRCVLLYILPVQVLVRASASTSSACIILLITL